jgi:hypothetical protein
MVPTTSHTQTLICCADKVLNWNFIWSSTGAIKQLYKNRPTIQNEPIWVYLVNVDMYSKVKDKIYADACLMTATWKCIAQDVKLFFLKNIAMLRPPVMWWPFCTSKGEKLPVLIPSY